MHFNQRVIRTPSNFPILMPLIMTIRSENQRKSSFLNYSSKSVIKWFRRAVIDYKTAASESSPSLLVVFSPGWRNLKMLSSNSTCAAYDFDWVIRSIYVREPLIVCLRFDSVLLHFCALLLHFLFGRSESSKIVHRVRRRRHLIHLIVKVVEIWTEVIAGPTQATSYSH